MEQLTVGSLFSGIGGLDLGLERAGMRVAWQCESDPYCRAVLARHWPGIPCYPEVGALADAATLQRQEVERDEPDRVLSPDVLCGGFPCQPVSLAGRRRAQDDARWLWPQFARLIGLLRPRYVLVENVPGLLSAGHGIVLGDLANLGYDAEWDCIPAAAVGAPHLRYRVFLVAYPEKHGWKSWWPRDAAQEQRGREPDRSNLGTGEVENTRSGRQWLDCRASGTIWPPNPPDQSGWWATEPNVGRVAHGIPSRVDRLRALGNAVVPQVAEWVGRQIMNAEARS